MLSKTNTHQLKYEAMQPHAPTKQGIRVISDMRSGSIIAFLLNRHKVGLLWLSNITLVSYMLYDKLHWLWG